jgi:DNA-binding winged helix-turn-helix (wHTH) protein
MRDHDGLLVIVNLLAIRGRVLGVPWEKRLVSIMTRHSFDRFSIDTDTRELRRDGEPVRISPKAFDLLAFLVEQRPRVVSKTEILENVWTGTYVADTTLAGVIAELRAALQDDARSPLFIRTAHRVGYAFCGEVQENAEPPGEPGTVYVLIVEDRQLKLGAGRNVLGRDRAATLWIDHPSISRRHAAIVIDSASATIEDLGSKNGTFLHGRRLEKAEPIADGDEIRLGNDAMLVRAFVDGVPTASVTSR